jgi:hypothetical protein
MRRQSSHGEDPQRLSRAAAEERILGHVEVDASGIVDPGRDRVAGPRDGVRLRKRAAGSFGAASEGPVEVKGSADHREVHEGLGEVAHGLAAQPGLLGFQAQPPRHLQFGIPPPHHAVLLVLHLHVPDRLSRPALEVAAVTFERPSTTSRRRLPCLESSEAFAYFVRAEKQCEFLRK